jgi:chromate transport protein ChrA
MAAYLLGTLAGLAPRTLAVVVAFANLQQLDFSRPQEAWMRIAGIVATIAVAYVITRIGQNAVRGLTTPGGDFSDRANDRSTPGVAK